MDEAAAIGRRQRRRPHPAGRLAVFPLASCQDDPVVAIGCQPDDLEPAVRVGHVQQRAVRRPASADVDAAVARDHPERTAGDVDEGDLSRLVHVLTEVMAHDREP